MPVARSTSLYGTLAHNLTPTKLYRGTAMIYPEKNWCCSLRCCLCGIRLCIKSSLPFHCSKSSKLPRNAPHFCSMVLSDTASLGRVLLCAVGLVFSPFGAAAASVVFRSCSSEMFFVVVSFALSLRWLSSLTSLKTYAYSSILPCGTLTRAPGLQLRRVHFFCAVLAVQCF